MYHSLSLYCFTIWFPFMREAFIHRNIDINKYPVLKGPKITAIKPYDRWNAHTVNKRQLYNKDG